ncbi:hypothetical protein B0H21DRAFT_154176 [Amylocystis lapponica]|nr:hypothetical protein B0H21DRAFT_154176 [Amylocystis lapponica]
MVPQSFSSATLSTQIVGLSPSITLFNEYTSAAGYTDSAIFQGLQDPPFISGGWTIAEFISPATTGLSASLQVETTGIYTSVDCSKAEASFTSSSTNSSDTTYILNATTADGCYAQHTFHPGDGDQQYGVSAVNPASCGMNTETSEARLPILFWFLRNTTKAVDTSSWDNLHAHYSCLRRPCQYCQQQQSHIRSSYTQLHYPEQRDWSLERATLQRCDL